MSYKSLFTVIIFSCAFFLLSLTAHAAPLDDKLDDLRNSVPAQASELLDGIEPGITLNAQEALSGITEKLMQNIRAPVTSAIKNGAALVAVSVLCAAAGIFTGKDGAAYVRLAGVLTAAAVSLTGVRSLVGSAAEAMSGLYAFGNALLPTVAAAAAASGSVTGGTVKFAASSLFMDMLIAVGERLVMPMIYVYIAAGAASAAFGGAVKSAVKLIKWCVNITLTVLVTAFTVYLSVTGIIASTADAAAVKVTKTALSTLLPVVGKLVADASDSVASGFAVLKNAAGTFGILVIIAVCAEPFLYLLANYLVFKAAAALSEPVAGDALAGFISDLGTALGFAMAAVGACAAVLYISVIASIKAVSG